MAKKFSSSEAVKHGFNQTKKYFGFLFILGLIYFGTIILTGLLEKHTPKPFSYFLSLSFWILNMLMTIGIIKISLMISRDEQPTLSELFSNVAPLINFVLASICYGLVVFGGFLLLIIPGIIFSVMFQMYSYLIVDKDMGPIESLNHSRSITKGSRMNLFVFGFVLCLINLVGLLCLGIGLLISFPTTLIAIAYVYDRLENSNETVEATT